MLKNTPVVLLLLIVRSAASRRCWIYVLITVILSAKRIMFYFPVKLWHIYDPDRWKKLLITRVDWSRNWWMLLFFKKSAFGLWTVRTKLVRNKTFEDVTRTFFTIWRHFMHMTCLLNENSLCGCFNLLADDCNDAG